MGKSKVTIVQPVVKLEYRVRQRSYGLGNKGEYLIETFKSKPYREIKTEVDWSGKLHNINSNYYVKELDSYVEVLNIIESIDGNYLYVISPELEEPENKDELLAKLEVERDELNKKQRELKVEIKLKELRVENENLELKVKLLESKEPPLPNTVPRLKNEKWWKFW